MIDAPGIYPDIPADDYHADCCVGPSLSSSIIKLLVNASPLHAWTAHAKLNPYGVKQESESFDIGNAAHALLLEGADRMTVIDPRNYPSKTGSIPAGWTNNAIRAARDQARAAGRHPVLLDQHEDIVQMARVARNAIAAAPEMAGWDEGDSELTLVWQEGELWCRARIDRRLQGMLFDYKSTANASPDVWSRNRLVEMGYDIQAAWYLRGWKALTGESDTDFVFGVQEIAKPYEFSLVGVSHAMLELGRRKVDMGLALWARCMLTGQWPGYPRQICWPDPQNWHESRFEERQVFNELLGGQA